MSFANKFKRILLYDEAHVSKIIKLENSDPDLVYIRMYKYIKLNIWVDLRYTPYALKYLFIEQVLLVQWDVKL